MHSQIPDGVFGIHFTMFDMTILLYNVKLYITTSNSWYQNEARKGILDARRKREKLKRTVLVTSCCILYLSDFCAIWTKEETKVVQQSSSGSGSVKKWCRFLPRIWCHLRTPPSSTGGKCKVINSAEKTGKTGGKKPVMSRQVPAFSL